MSYYFSDKKDVSSGDGGQGSIFDPSSSTNEGAGVPYVSPAKFSMNNKPSIEGVYYGSPEKCIRKTNQPRSSPLTDSPVPWKKSTSNIPDDFKFPTPVPGNELSTPGGLKRRSSGEGDKRQQEFPLQDQRSFAGGEGGHVSRGGQLSRDSQDNHGDSENVMPSEKRTNISQDASSHCGEQGSGLDKKDKIDNSDGVLSTQALLENMLNRQREQLSGILTQVGTAELNDQKILVTIRKVSQDTAAYSIDLQKIKEQYQTRLATVSSFLSKMPGQSNDNSSR